MTLLITIFAAITTTIIWYVNASKDKMMLGILPLMFWGASLMWMIDAVFEFVEDPKCFFAPAGADMINDAFLGFSVVALGLIIWLVVLLINDPQGVVRAKLTGKRS